MDEKELFLKSFEEKLMKSFEEKELQGLSKNGSFEEFGSVTYDYERFRMETIPRSANYFERLCNFSEKILNIKPDKKTEKKLNEKIYAAHLGCSPTGVLSFAIFASSLTIFFALLFYKIAFLIFIGITLLGLSLYLIIQTIPGLFANKMKSKANDEVIISIFYIVAYMRYNSNFELAVNFAATYLNPPLSLDFKRLLWELNNAKFPNIKEAFDKYLENWREQNLEFLEAIYMIESSLYESEEFRRLSLLDKALDVVLKGNFEKMIHFAQELKGKVTVFNMLGVVLPILGLIVLPLAASFGSPKGIWQIVILLYNIILPAIISYFAFMIVFNRPSSVNSIKTPTELKNFRKIQMIKYNISKKKVIYINPKIPAIAIFILFLSIGISPLVFHFIGMDEGLNTIFSNIPIPGKYKDSFGIFQEFKIIESEYKFGPYGFWPGLISLFIPLSFAFGIGYYLKYKFQNLIKIRNKTKKLETQFPSATFQLGNRINEGISPELAFGAVSDTMKGTEAGEFFSRIDKNIKFNGMSIKKAIFDKEKGAIIEYPSDMILSSMKILINAIDRGPEISAKTLIDLSNYMTDIHMSNQRLNDLLTESLSSMKSQASFLAPLISGVVISIVSLVSSIMSKVTKQISALGTGSSFLGESMPTYLFQISVGLYIALLITILVYLVSNLENGEDPVFTKYSIGEKLIGGITKYTVIVAIGITFFTFVAGIIPIG